MPCWGNRKVRHVSSAACRPHPGLEGSRRGTWEQNDIPCCCPELPHYCRGSSSLGFLLSGDMWEWESPSAFPLGTAGRRQLTHSQKHPANKPTRKYRLMVSKMLLLDPSGSKATALDLLFLVDESWDGHRTKPKDGNKQYSTDQSTGQEKVAAARAKHK